MSEPRIEESREKLIRELGLVRARGIFRVESRQHKPLDLPLLKSHSGKYAGNGKSFIASLELLIRDSVKRLPNGLTKNIATVIYGLDKDITQAKPDVWRKEALKFIPLASMDDFRKGMEQHVLTLIASEIEVMVASPGPGEIVVPHAGGLERKRSVSLRRRALSYLRRTSYHDDFGHLLHQGHDLLAITGDSGNGKSRFAYEAVTERCLSTSEWALVHAESDSALLRSMSRVLAAQGMETAAYDADGLQRAFISYLNGPYAPEFLVLDNASDWQVVSKIVDFAESCVIVITSVQRLIPGSRKHGEIKIGAMDPTMSVEMVRSLIPDCSAEDAALLAHLAGGKPLIVEGTCHHVLQSYGVLTLQQFLEEFSVDASSAVRFRNIPAEETLTYVYKKILDKLSVAEPGAMAILGYVAFLADEPVPLSFLEEVQKADQVPKNIFRNDMATLLDTALVDLSEEQVTINSLTRELVQAYGANWKHKICLRLHHALSKYLRQNSANILNIDLFVWMPHIDSVLRSLVDLDSPEEETAVARTVLFLARNLRGVDSRANRIRRLAHFASGGHIDSFQPTKFIQRHASFQELANTASTEKKQIGSAAIRLFDEIAVELIEEFYFCGIISREEYWTRLLRAYGDFSNEDKRTIKISGPSETIGIVVTRILSVNYNFKEIIRLHEDLTANTENSPSFLNSQLLTLISEAYSAQGKWRRAIELFQQAANFEKKLPAAAISAALGAIDAQIEFGEEDRMVNLLTDLLSTNHDVALHVQVGTEIEEVKYPPLDPLYLGLLSHKLAWCRTVRILLGDDDPGTPTTISELYARAGNFYQWLGTERHLVELSYCSTIYELSQGATLASVRKQLQSGVRKAQRLKEKHLALRYELAFSKLRIFEGTCTRHDLERCQRVAKQYDDECEMLNGKADALGVSYVVAASLHSAQDELDSIRNEAQSAYQEIDKLNKWQKLLKFGTDEFDARTLFLP